MLTFDLMMMVKCPKCGLEKEYAGNDFRPFCSERCKMLDFGAWIEEEYALPAEESEITDEDMDQIERTLAERNGSQ